MGEIKIEKAAIIDINRICDLYSILTGEKSDKLNMKEMFLTFNNNEDYYLMVAKINGYVVATGTGIVFRSLANNCKPYFIIDNVVVDPNYQHRGIGTCLLNKLHEIALNNNCCMAYLVAEESNINAARFYRKLGYTDAVTGFQKTFLH